jgi:putative membrane-bound dehydrogenase-like protein
MRPILALFALLGIAPAAFAADPPPALKVADGWRADLVARAPEILFPTAIVAAPDGTIYVGQDPMDMPGPPTAPIDSIVAIGRGGKRTLFADKLWAVMGLEWVDDTLYVVHAPYLSALRDTNGDGKADSRVDLMTGLGPENPGFNGINDHIASGIRLGIDGFLYIAVGDKGIPKGVGKDGKTIRLFGGGVIRIRPDGTDLEVVSTGERNPLSVALGATDEIFTYGNDDDSKRWPNSLTHHIVGGHYGYPYQFLTAPWRCLPIVAGELGGSGTQGICYNEDGLPASYRGGFFFCDWGLQTVFRFKLEKSGGTYKLKEKTPFVEAGTVRDFRPFSLAVAPDGATLYLVDWAYLGWLADGPRTGRIYRLTYHGPDRVTGRPRPAIPRRAQDGPEAMLDHPALSVRRAHQRALAAGGVANVATLAKRLASNGPPTGRIHALWALDAIGAPEAREAIRAALADPVAEVRLQAARSAGIRHDRSALAALGKMLNDQDAVVRREAAIALGKLDDKGAAPALYAHLNEADTFAAWSVRQAIRSLKAWDESALVAALADPARRENALKLADEAWSVAVVDALIATLSKLDDAPTRARIVMILGGLYRKYPEWSGHWFGTNPLAGRAPVPTRDWSPEGMARVLAGLATGLNDRDPAVRLAAVPGLRGVGRLAVTHLQGRLDVEQDPRCLVALAGAVGALGDAASISTLSRLVQDARRPAEVRAAALDALGGIPSPVAYRARLTLIYDAKAPADLVARALPPLGRAKLLPPNDLGGFLTHAAPEVRAAALTTLAERGTLPSDLRLSVVDRLDDPSVEVRRAAMVACAHLKIREAIPRLLAAAQSGGETVEATLALAALPDPRASAIYLAALGDRNPELRRTSESALLTIRDLVAGDLESRARSNDLAPVAAEAVERVLTRFRPIVDWRVIGPFPRTTAPVFVGEPTINFTRSHSGVEGRPISWSSRRGDPKSGRVVIDDFKGGAGDRGGFGYDANGSPDLCAFGHAEVESDRDRPALLLLGSSGTMLVTVNEKIVFDYLNFAGRPYAPDSDRVRVDLRRGRNKILVKSRQGIGTWSFGVQVSDPSVSLFATRPGKVGLEELRAYAMGHEGNPARGEAIFFDPKGIGCVKCHSAGGRGTAAVGPDLTGLAAKYDKAEIVRSVLEPSGRIATGYQPLLLARSDGQVLTGLVRAETDSFLELVDADAKITRVAKSEIEERRVGDVSLMPTGLVDTLRPYEFADLIAYLVSLKAPPRPTAGR